MMLKNIEAIIRNPSGIAGSLSAWVCTPTSPSRKTSPKTSPATHRESAAWKGSLLSWPTPSVVPRDRSNKIPAVGHQDAPGLLVGGWATPLKNMSSSIGMMKFPTKPPTSLLLLPTIERNCWKELLKTILTIELTPLYWAQLLGVWDMIEISQDDGA